MALEGVASTDLIETTDDHPWWVAGKGWLETKDLVSGMAVVTQDGRGMTIAAVTKTDSIAPVFNLTIDDFHTFFVGEHQVLVHNCPIDPGDVERISPDRIAGPVTVGRKQYPIRESNFGYCDPQFKRDFTRSCGTVVKPQQTLVAEIPFEEFKGKLPLSHRVRRELNYSPTVSYCDMDGSSGLRP